jgi:quinoprotein relay system zinc metallohydrolase 1
MRLIVFLLACIVCTAQAGQDYALSPRQIAEDTWLLEGSTGNFDKANGGNIVNTGFIVTDAGVVVIDTGPSRAYGDAMRRVITQVTDQPVALVLLTHHHPDHVLGNQAFTDVPIAALAGARKLLDEQGNAMAENMYRLVGDWMRGTEVVLPTETLEPSVREVGGHRLRLLALRGHTGADLAVLDERTGVLFAGDLVFYQRALTTPNSPGLDGLLKEAAGKGEDMNEVIRSPIPQRFALVNLSRYELIRTVSHLYPKYELARMPRVDSATE